LLVLVSSPTVWSLGPHSDSPSSVVFDQVRNDLSVPLTGLIATSVVVADWLTSPRWTLTPQEYSVTDQRMLMAAGEVSSVDRANSSVVALASRPRTVAATGRALSEPVLKVRNALAGSTAVMVTVCTPLAVFVAVPDCTPRSAARRHDGVVNVLPGTCARSLNRAFTDGTVATRLTARTTARTGFSQPGSRRPAISSVKYSGPGGRCRCDFCSERRSRSRVFPDISDHPFLVLMVRVSI
jgi:hypothetical protein